MKLRLLVVFLILSGFVRAQPTPGSDTLRILPDTFQNRMPLGPWLGLVHDPTRGMTLADARGQAALAFPDSSFLFPARSAIWFRFFLQNTSTVDSLRFCVGLVLYGMNRFEGQVVTPVGVSPLERAGVHVNYGDLSVPKDRRYLRMSVPPGATAEVWLYAEQFFSSFFPAKQVEIMPEASSEELRRDFLVNYRGEHMIMVMYLGIFGLMASVFGLFWLINRNERAYYWYALYALGTLLYYLRLFENRPSQNLFFTYRMEWYLGLEVTTSYLIYIAYIQFLRTFLNLRERAPRFDRRLREIGWFFAGWLVVDLLLIEAIWGQELSYSAFMLVRGVFFAVSFLAMAQLFRLIRYRPAFWVMLGSALLVVNGLLTLLAQWRGWPDENIWHGLLRRVTTGAGAFPFLNTKSAIVLEMLCFAVAFAAKYRLDREAILHKTSQVEAEKTALKQKLIVKATVETTDPFLLRLRSLAEEHLHDPRFDATALARLQGASLKILNARLLKIADTTAASFLRRLRLEKAAELLRTHPSLNITEIADRAGFSGGDVFSNVFRKYFGESPMEWRKKNGGFGQAGG